MVRVQHRAMQRHPQGLETPIKERTCSHCEQVYKSVLGLKNHQSRKSNYGCHRAGLKAKVVAFKKDKEAFEEALKRPEVSKNENLLSETHKRGKSYKKEEKQVYINVYQDWIDKGKIHKPFGLEI